MIDSENRRVLVYRIGQLGDTLVSVPAFWCVRLYYPNAHLALLSNANSEAGYVAGRSVLPKTGLFDEWIHYPADSQGTDLRSLFNLLRQLRPRRFDTLVYLAPRLRSRKSVVRDLLFFRLAGVTRIVAHRGFSPLPDRTPDQPLPLLEHEADHLLDRLRLSGIPVPLSGQGNLDLCLTTEEQQTADAWLKAQHVPPGSTLVGIAPGSKWQSKRWPEQNYADLGRRLIQQLGVYPIVFGGLEDAPTANSLISHWGAGSSAAGVLEVREAAAALKRCRLYVGNDTGTMHLAAAVGTSCVAVFSAQDWPGRWTPYGPGHTVIRRNVSCEGCRLTTCETEGLRCLTTISPADVVAECQRQLGK